jgi:hypothetical protein
MIAPFFSTLPRKSKHKPFLLAFNMRHLFFILLSFFVSIGFFSAACGGNFGTADAPGGIAPGGISSQPMPEIVDSAEVAFRDLNYWTENNLFCIATIVDNTAPFWRRIWVRIELLDAAGQVLKIDGAPNMVVRALADAIAPKGASAFFVAIPFSQVSGVPVSCRLSGAGAVAQNPGPILLSSEIGGVRMLQPDPKDSTKTVETAFQASATLENPLDLTAEHPRVVLLLYGKDEKLYFVQMLDPEDPKKLITLERDGPMIPQERRKMYCPISYAMLPQKLRELLIGRVDVQVYDVRN